MPGPGARAGRGPWERPPCGAFGGRDYTCRLVGLEAAILGYALCCLSCLQGRGSGCWRECEYLRRKPKTMCILRPANDISFNAVVAACEQGERRHASESQNGKA